MIYCDTSLLVAIITAETLSGIARSWYFGDARPPCAISDWSRTEIASAIARKHRSGIIDDDQRHAAETAWKALEAEMMLIEVTAAHFARAAILVDSAPRGLRSGDSLHLSIVLDRGCDLATFDRDLADAARVLGVALYPA